MITRCVLSSPQCGWSHFIIYNLYFISKECFIRNADVLVLHCAIPVFKTDQELHFPTQSAYDLKSMCFAKSASLFRIWNTRRCISFVSRPGATGDKGGIAHHINNLCPPPPSFMNQLYLFRSEIDKPNYFEVHVSEPIWCILICTDRLTWSSVCHQSRQQQENSSRLR